jgi:hypothetical protein
VDVSPSFVDRKNSLSKTSVFLTPQNTKPKTSVILNTPLCPLTGYLEQGMFVLAIFNSYLMPDVNYEASRNCSVFAANTEEWKKTRGG